MSYYKCRYCELSQLSEENNKEHEIKCPKNPKNINMTPEQFKKRMQLKK